MNIEGTITATPKIVMRLPILAVLPNIARCNLPGPRVLVTKYSPIIIPMAANSGMPVIKVVIKKIAKNNVLPEA